MLFRRFCREMQMLFSFVPMHVLRVHADLGGVCAAACCQASSNGIDGIPRCAVASPLQLLPHACLHLHSR